MNGLLAFCKRRDVIISFSLILVFLALGGLAWWDEWKTKQEDKEKEGKNKLVFFDPEEVKEIDYFNKNVPTDEKIKGGEKTAEEKKPEKIKVHLVKKDGDWRVTRPLDVVADKTAVKGMLDTLKDYKFEKIVAETRSQWADFGLNPPNRKIELAYVPKGSVEPQKITVYIGNKSTIGYSVYSATDKSDRVYIGSQYLLVSTAKSMTDFRDKRLVEIKEEDLKSISYKLQENDEIKIVRKDGKYKITSPEELEADNEEVKDFVRELDSAKVEEFTDNPKNEDRELFKTDKRYAAISWTMSNGSGNKLIFAEKDGKIWGAFTPWKVIFRLPDDFKGKLKKTVFNFRARKVFSFDADSIVKIDIDGVKYKKVDNEWYSEDDAIKTEDLLNKRTEKDKKEDKLPEGMPKAKDYIRSLVVDFEFAKGENFIELDDPLLKKLPEAPLHKISLEFKDNKIPPMVMAVWANPRNSERYYVRYPEGKFLFEVPKSTFNNIRESILPAATEDVGVK